MVDALVQIAVSSHQSMTELTLTAIFEEAEEGGYIGYVAELPGANTQGETLEEVRENLAEAIELILNSGYSTTFHVSRQLLATDYTDLLRIRLRLLLNTLQLFLPYPTAPHRVIKLRRQSLILVLA